MQAHLVFAEARDPDLLAEVFVKEGPDTGRLSSVETDGAARAASMPTELG